MKQAITGAAVLNGRGDPPLKNATIVIEDDHIAEVGSAASTTVPPDAVVWALDSSYTVMPGLIDCHDHVGHPGLGASALTAKTVPHAVALVAKALRETIEGGVTTLRDAGGLGYGFKVAVDEGLFLGPRLVLSLAIMSRTGGLGDACGIFGYGTEQWIIPGVPNGVCDGTDGGRTKVRELHRSGAGAIKVAMTGGIRSGALQPGFTEAEVAAVVDEAHALDLRVLCHCHGGPGLRYALSAGVDSIDHGLYLVDDEESMRRMADQGTFYVPTMLVLRYHGNVGEGRAQETALKLREQHRRGLVRSAELGVRIASGTDAGAFGHSHHACELEMFVEAGFSSADAVRFATSSSAECLGLGDSLGTLDTGYLADLLVVDGDPLADVRILQDRERIKMVMKGGVPVRETLGGPRSATDREGGAPA